MKIHFHQFHQNSSFSAIRVVSSAYMRLLIFLPAILIPACTSSSPVFLMMYSAYKLNERDYSIQPSHTPFPLWNQFVVPCPVLTVASWPAYRFCKRQSKCSGISMLLGASVRNSARGKGHEKGGSAYAKAGSSLRSPPGNSRASTPKTRVCLLSALCSHLHLWLYGGLSPTTSLWKKS